MISRKRELEKAILAAFVTWADTDLPATVKRYTSRQTRDNDAPHVVVSCNAQKPEQGMDEYVYRMEVSGAITCSALVDGGDPDTIETLEILAENFVELLTPTILTAINDETTTIEVTDFQPDDSEDGYNDGLKRYVSRYSFTAIVRDITE